MKRTVYVAGPLSSSGDRLSNVERACLVGRRLVELGFSPLVPHLTHHMDPDDDLGWDTWLEVDEAWIVNADAVLRMDGPSRGADRECEFATDHGIPVVHSIPALLELFSRRIVGLAGYMGAGKNEVGAILEREWSYAQIALADPLKAVALECGWDGTKRPQEDYGSHRFDVADNFRPGAYNGRLLLQRLGNAMREEVGPNVWIESLFRRMHPGLHYVVTDVRYPNEADAIRDAGGEVWWIRRPGHHGDGHISERPDALDAEVTIDNDGTLDDLAAKVGEVMGWGRASADLAARNLSAAQAERLPAREKVGGWFRKRSSPSRVSG